ncbi:DNA-binding protein [Pseudomonas sp. efr-133-TYG-5]|jgi:CheY-like chemotaxis protein|uniref:DNA-binding protein n=1 Tax=Pseudomonas sp. efr-133-TYG-5 TaxID=3040310 RepID=UPI002557C05B|nr:DNA-binding protein [Pseudomonas sp. efr-133-TYG-5]
MRSLKVLILEPNPFQLMALHQMLNAIGIYDVLTAPSLHAALASLARRGTIDIVICDPQARDGEGRALIRHLALEQQAQALILLGNVAACLPEELRVLLQDHPLRLLGWLHTPVSAVLMRGLLDAYLQQRDQRVDA